MKRRDFIKTCVAAGSGLALSGFTKSQNIPKTNRGRALSYKGSKKMIVLGLDGMDPVFTAQMMQAGELPNFQRLAEKGHFGPLGTTLPPQSPVAWSSFITGTNPGGHGIYDFIHRDPKTLIPFLSTSKSIAGESSIKVGKYSIPIDSGRVELMRHGVPFWKYLDEQSIETNVHALPANFPVVPEGAVKAISGMGTPDLLGGYGTYTYFSDQPVPGSSEFSGGKVVRISMRTHSFSSEIEGPRNPFVEGNPKTSVPVTVYRDPVSSVVRIDISDQQIVLREGEWSNWIPLKFEFAALLGSAAGMVRFYAKQVHSNFLMYVTPVNIDPMDPALPICSPAGYSKELAEKVGRFYTQGLPADTKALNEGVLTSSDFLSQSKIVLQECLDLFDYQFARFKEGFFLFYFSSLDQNSHMLWRCMDPKHPLYEPNASAEVKGAIRYYYKAMDAMLKQVLDQLDSNTDLIVLSDHGFTDFTREFHLSTWLYENGYIALTKPDKMEEMDYFDYVDWSKTSAYPVGINGLYLNLKDRERNGSVSREQALRIKQDLAAKLCEIRDPRNGTKIIRKVYDAEQAYSGPYVHLAPDLVIGYERGYRISDEAILGKFPRGIIADRTKAWSADHCMDPVAMPGVLFSNRKLNRDNPGIWDLAPSILEAFDIQANPAMTGKPVFRKA